MATTKSTRKGATRHTRNWKPRFLSALAKSGTVTAACKAAKVDRSRAYKERHRDEDFALAWADALEEGCDELEEEARRRALHGSDYLLVTLLKAHRPERFAERAKLEHTGADGGPIRHAHGMDLSKLDTEELHELRRLSAKASAA